MARGKKDQPDYIPAGSTETRSLDPTDERVSAVDIGQDFTASTDVTQLPLADPFEQ